MKQTHKRKSLGNVAAIVAAAPSLSAAARQLGVNRSTLHRWIVAGEVPKPDSQRDSAPVGVASADQTPAEWAQKVRSLGEMTATDMALVDLAESALIISRDVTGRPETRLAAMGRYQRLVAQLRLDRQEAEAPGQPERKQPQQSAPKRTSVDPRHFLVAVK